MVGISVDVVVALLAEGDSAFLAHHRVPVLLLHTGAISTENRADARASTVPVGTARAFFRAPPVTHVTPLMRSGRQPFPMVTVGRAASNDVTLVAPSVSKVHASFSQDHQGHWCITDSGSSNGTTLNSVRLPSHAITPLQEGDVIVFGGAVHATYQTPTGLLAWARLERARRS